MHLMCDLLQQSRCMPAELRQGWLRQEMQDQGRLFLGGDLVPTQHQREARSGHLPHRQEETSEEEKEQEQA